MENMQPHIRCGRKDAAKYAVLPGDPKRVERAKEYLSDVKEISFNREYKSIAGTYKGTQILVISTGMGGTSTGIAVEELKNIGVETMIRIGSCGTLQENIHLGDLIIVNGVVRDDGASRTYIKDMYPAIPDTELLIALIDVAKEMKVPYHIGKVRSHDSFYTEQENEIDEYWSSKGILGSDMETAALFTIGGLRGVRTASVLNTVAEYNGDLKEEINDYANGSEVLMTGEKNEILMAFEACVKMESILNSGN